MIAYTLQQLFAPLTIALESRSAALSLLDDLGWTLGEQFQLDAFEPLSPVALKLTDLAGEIAEYEAGAREIGEVIEEAIELGAAIYTALEDLRDVADGDVSNLISPMNTAGFWEELALDLPEYLILTYLETYLPLVFAVMDFGGAIGSEERLDGRPARRIILWDELGQMVSDPAGQIRDTYNWGGPLEHALLTQRLGKVFSAMSLPVRRYQIPGALVVERFGGNAPADAIALGVPLLAAGLQSAGLTASGRLDLLLAPVPRTGSDPTGVLLILQALGQVEHTLELGDGWRLTSAVSVDAAGTLGLELQPEGLSAPVEMSDGSVSLELTAAPDEPLILLGQAGTTRIELTRFDANASVLLNSGSPGLEANLGLSGMTLVIAPGEGDSFLANILGDIEFAIPMELVLNWSDSDGLSISGGIGIDIEIPVNRKIGPLEIFWVALKAMAGTDGVEIAASTAGSLTIGPFIGTIDGIGFKVQITPRPRDARGGKGALDILAGFKPPEGLGLALDAPGISGGGYLYINPDEGRYAGILNVDLLGLEITAIGLIATKLPGGEAGWSMFLSLSLEFSTGIQLGFGFKLTGVGGLAGINRGIDIEALGEGVRTGALDAILFPSDPIANAPMILNTLDTIFPTQQGQYVFGPVFQLAWGTPTLVTIQLCLAIQLPSPLTISLLGSILLEIALDDTVVLSIQVDVAGTLWPTEGRLAIDNSIRQGKIAMLSLSGDMSVRADFGASRPSYLFASGGFHPHFTPPDGFPALNRVALKIFDEEHLRVGVESYLAVTSNSLHFGVAAYFWAKAVGLTAAGRFEFDTLIYLKPFGMVASLGFQIAVSAGSKELLHVGMRGTLKGPQPWLIDGNAEFRALGMKKEFHVEMTLGRSVQEGPREIADVFTEVLNALRDDDAWGEGDTDATILEAVILDNPEGGNAAHPAGRLSVIQGVAPLNIRLEKFGESRVDAEDAFLSLVTARLNGDTATDTARQNWFSPAQFLELPEDERISAPSFEEMDAGLTIGEIQPRFPNADAFPMGYECKIVDPDVQAKWPKDMEEGEEPQISYPEPGGRINSDLTVLLNARDRTAPQFAVQAVSHVVSDPISRLKTSPQQSEATSWAANTAMVRSARQAGLRRVTQPAYELDLEGDG